MTEVLFYHLDRAPLDRVLPDLLQRTLSRGQRALVRCGSPEALEHLDEALWTFRDESFVPHGLAGEAFENEQPILLTLGTEAPNGARWAFLVASATALPDEMARFERAVVLFGATEAEEAREAWRAVKAAGMEATYWKQTERGGWEKAG